MILNIYKHFLKFQLFKLFQLRCIDGSNFWLPNKMRGGVDLTGIRTVFAGEACVGGQACTAKVLQKNYLRIEEEAYRIERR
jgi:hypothetical protein